MIGRHILNKYFASSNLYILFLVLFSFFINQFYSYLGVLPVDSFSTFNSGYDILNGSLPFKDFWTIKGPVLDLIQALYFKIFGVSWFSYAAHSSTFNTIFALATFFTLRQFKLKNKYCFFYSILASILMYPTYGTPFTDHHVSIFSLLSVYSLCLAIKIKRNIYWFIIPLLLFLAFFTKQTPAGYFGILVTVISLLYLILNFDKKIIIFALASSAIAISSLVIVIFLYQIPIESFLVQYFLFPMSLGESRLEWLLPFEFQRFVLRHKLIYLALSIPIFLLFKNVIKNFSSILKDDNLIFLLLFGTLIIFISHQLMTINGLFIYFLIPVFSGFSHAYLDTFKSKNRLVLFFMLLSFISTFYYHQKYIVKRDTLILRNINLKQSIDAKLLSKKLKHLRWITHHYPNNPKKEINLLNSAIKIIQMDESKKMIVTDYQFISVILSIPDNSAARIWWRHHIYPEPNKKFFNYWKSFLLEKIKKENITVIYTVHPLEGEVNIFEGLVDKNCYSSKQITQVLVMQKLNSCEEFKSF